MVNDLVSQKTTFTFLDISRHQAVFFLKFICHVCIVSTYAQSDTVKGLKLPLGGGPTVL